MCAPPPSSSQSICMAPCKTQVCMSGAMQSPTQYGLQPYSLRHQNTSTVVGMPWKVGQGRGALTMSLCSAVQSPC